MVAPEYVSSTEGIESWKCVPCQPSLIETLPQNKNQQKKTIQYICRIIKLDLLIMKLGL